MFGVVPVRTLNGCRAHVPQKAEPGMKSRRLGKNKQAEDQSAL
ncbi:hypothetical protein [Streptosporangium lutulentum]|nr:hypothetical protein [Streptosporangium lutulentum]